MVYSIFDLVTVFPSGAVLPSSIVMGISLFGENMFIIIIGDRRFDMPGVNLSVTLETRSDAWARYHAHQAAIAWSHQEFDLFRVWAWSWSGVGSGPGLEP